MGATDNSFIKAYQQEPETDTSSREKLPGVYADETGFTVSTASVSAALATRQQAVSHLYAAADRIRTRSASISEHAAAVVTPANLPGVRIDGADPVMPPAPHLAVATLAEATPSTPEPEVATPTGIPGTIDSPMPVVTPVPVPAENEWLEPPAVETEVALHRPAQESPEVAEVLETGGMEFVATESVEAQLPLADSETETKIDEGIGLEPWKPQWEVERVAWPAIVEQLTEEWTGELSALIRPLLTSAWQGRNVIAVTSFTRDEGASTMAMCLAKMAASFRVPVALIDGDLVEPNIGASLGLAFGQGWNTLPTELPLSEAAIASSSDRIVVVPGSTHLGLGDQATTAYHALGELSKNFDLVILDAGPIFTAAHRWFDSPAAENIHGTLIVQDVRSTSGDQVDDVCSRLGEVGMDHVAIVENFRRAA